MEFYVTDVDLNEIGGFLIAWTVALCLLATAFYLPLIWMAFTTGRNRERRRWERKLGVGLENVRRVRKTPVVRDDKPS